MYIMCENINLKTMEYSSNLLQTADLGLGEVKYPIPITWKGNTTVAEFNSLSLVSLDDYDEECMWAATIETARFLLKNGHELIKNPEVLERQKLFRQNPKFREKYPFWYR